MLYLFPFRLIHLLEGDLDNYIMSYYHPLSHRNCTSRYRYYTKMRVHVFSNNFTVSVVLKYCA